LPINLFWLSLGNPLAVSYRVNHVWQFDVQFIALPTNPFPSKAHAPMASTNRDARLNFRLPAELKLTIEEAASELGQTISDFAISTLVQTARRVIHERNATILSSRDRAIFMALLDDKSAKPNQAIRDAAKHYHKQVD
jgi:uncharacterized protein (DUF1778 family)